MSVECLTEYDVLQKLRQQASNDHQIGLTWPEAGVTG
jgi:hypothetical protein